MTAPSTPLSRGIRIGLPLAAALAMVLLMLTPAWNLEEGAGLRLLYGLRGVRPPPPKVVIIALDSASARALGQSERPERWPRGLHARLLGALADRGAAVIGFDILFERQRDPADDQRLADAMRRAGNVMLVEQVVREAIPGADGRHLGSVDRRIRALPMFLDAAAGSGPFVLPKTPDGVLEYWDYVPSAGDQPSLPMLMATAMAVRDGRSPPAPVEGRRRVLGLYGPLGSVSTLSYARALELAEDPARGAAAFAGKAVLIGFSESNQSRQADAFRTAYTGSDEVDVSGVELCATAIANLLDGTGLLRPADTTLVPALALWAAVLALPWSLLPPRRAALTCLALSLGALGGVSWAFSQQSAWLPVILPVAIAPALAGLFGSAAHFRAARRRTAQLEKALDLGLTREGSEALVTLLRGREGGRTVHGVCLSSDIEGYTALSESLSPEAARDVLNRYFACFIPVIQAHGGHVMDIVGDAVLSLWLADDSATDACARARAAALELHRQMNETPLEGALPTRFGLHYGPVFLGELGATHHREIRAVGNIVNTASRIQGANKPLGTRILASADVAAGGGPGHLRALGAFVLAGKSAPVSLVELRPQPLPEGVVASFAEGLAAYAGGARDAARLRFDEVLAKIPDDGPAGFFARRCAAADGHLSDEEGWVVLTTK